LARLGEPQPALSAEAGPAIRIAPGKPLPLGTWPVNGGVNFALFSRHATAVQLELYTTATESSPFVTVHLDPVYHRTGDIWHAWIHGVCPGHCYGYRAYGPYAPHQGHRFYPQRLLLDPYAVAVAGVANGDFSRARDEDPWVRVSGAPPAGPGNASDAPKALCLAPPYDWQGDRPWRRPWQETIIYETHVRGFTRHPSSGVRYPGTYHGLREKIPYLKELGITAVELLPVQEFNENENVRRNPLTGARLRNYWGYSTVSFFAPKETYACRKYPGSQVAEFRDMVRAFHKAEIEIILDVVFNHTAEGNELGPTLSFRGLDNTIYYLLEEDRRYYRNYSGCGNTVNCNHPVVRDFIQDCLRYWAIEMHVDGFRFDLASVLGRDKDGHLLPNPPLLEHIAEDPILRDVKLIAEAWDAGGAYQVGHFPGRRWSEWNGRYRDDVRRYWRGEPGMRGAFASRLAGSADIYQHLGKQPINSINFVTCHDGFTLDDLVSYNDKHNEANGENNQDGTAANFSCNYGVEGPTDDPVIKAVRRRQIKNFLATLLLSRGIPMLLGGDEFCRSQGGNNNAYCQDNEVSWYHWQQLVQEQEIYRFTREMIVLRKRYAVLSEMRFYTDQEIRWFDLGGAPPDWHAPEGALGCLIQVPERGERLCLLFNPNAFAVVFHLPLMRPGGQWRVLVDTAAPMPRDVIAAPGAPLLSRPTCCGLESYSLAVLWEAAV
jgi:isoamylase